MSLVDVIAPKRGPGRPRKEVVDVTGLATALNAPVPVGIEEAVKKVEAAVAAFELAKSALNESQSIGMA